MSKKILFVYRHFSSFVKKDFEILNKNYSVTKLHATKNLPLLIFKFLILVPKGDIIFVQFAGWHAFLATSFAKIFRKRIIVVVGGYDAAKVPKLNYGVFASLWKSELAKFVYRNANKILVVDKSLKYNILKNTNLKIGDKIKIIHRGYDSKKWVPKGRKNNLIISVAIGNTWNRVRLKGLDTLVKGANFFPRTKFMIIGLFGKALKKLKELAPSNVKFIGPLPSDNLIKYYQKARVYCQLSLSEGLPNSLCEAMLCGCVPVGTKKGGIPTAIGKIGFYAPYGDAKTIAEAIKKALKSNKGKEARERIIKEFPLEKRKKELVKNINILFEK